jgi:hypothetical protein
MPSHSGVLPRNAVTKIADRREFDRLLRLAAKLQPSPGPQLLARKSDAPKEAVRVGVRRRTKPRRG